MLDARISLAIPIIGSPDYYTLLLNRALHTPSPLGPLQLVAPQYPTALNAFVKSHDPCNVPMINWSGKKLLICSGEKDDLVNYVDGGAEKFVEKLRANEVHVDVFVQAGWYAYRHLSVLIMMAHTLEHGNSGHRCSNEMAVKAAEFIWTHGLSVISNGQAKM